MTMKHRNAHLKYGIWEEHRRPSYWAKWLLSYILIICFMVGAFAGVVLTLVLIGSV